MSEEGNVDIYPDPNRDIYLNSKLSRVSFEIRYYPLLEIDTDLVKFHKEIRDELPIYTIEKGFKQDAITGLLNEQNIHRIRTEDGELIIIITTTNLSIQLKKYEKFESYRKMIKKFTDKFFEKFQAIQQLEFLGLRYINNFEFKIEGSINLNSTIEYFNFGVDSQEILERNIEDFQMQQKYNIQGAIFKKYIGLRKDGKFNLYDVKIDLDSNCVKIHKDELILNLNKLHKNIKEVFRNSITEKLKTDVLNKGKIQNGQ